MMQEVNKIARLILSCEISAEVEHLCVRASNQIKLPVESEFMQLLLIKVRQGPRLDVSDGVVC